MPAMRNIRGRARAASGAAIVFLAGLSPASVGSADYPVRPVRFVVPFAASTTTDAIARFVGRKLTEGWSQQLVEDNRRRGGGTIVGAELVSRAALDGYTLVPASLNFVCAGTGSPTHLGAEVFRALAGIDIVLITSKGAAPGLVDLIANQVQTNILI